MKEKKITLVDVSSDRDKGDLAIVETTLNLIKNRTDDITLISEVKTITEFNEMKWMGDLKYERFGVFPLRVQEGIFLLKY